MSTVISRLYNWVTDKANGTKITASRQDGELDQMITALNRKVLCSGSAPSSPIAGQTWYDTTNKLLKVYRNNEWVGVAVHVGTAAPSTPQEGDIWWDSTNNLLKVYNGSSQITIPQGVPTNFRDGMKVAQASSATITVGLGNLEINGGIVTKTTVTTLTLTTAGDWAGGASLQAVSTYGFVGIDASGNLKLHTTAPTHADYGVSVATAKKRYATWGGTVYRIIGWFYMNSTGSGELNAYEVSNLPEGSVRSRVTRVGTTADTVNDTVYGTDLTETVIHAYCFGGNVNVRHISTTQTANGMNNAYSVILDVDGTDKANSEVNACDAGTLYGTVNMDYDEVLAVGGHTLTIQGKVTGSDDKIDRKTTRFEEEA